MRLAKNGLVRETDQQTGIDRLLANGYMPVASGEAAAKPLRGDMLEALMGQTVEQLRELCRQRGLDPPAGVKKAELAKAIVAYGLSCQEEPRDG